MEAKSRWSWAGVLGVAVLMSTVGWGRDFRPFRSASGVRALTSSTRAEGGFSPAVTPPVAEPTRAAVRSEDGDPEGEVVPVPLKGGCGTEVLLTVLRPPLARPAWVQVVAEESGEVLERAWDAYYGDAWRRLYPRMDVHPRVGPLSAEGTPVPEIQTADSRSYRHPWPRTPVPPRFRGQVPYYFYRYPYDRPFYYRYYYRPFYYRRFFFVVPFFRVYPFYFFYDPFFYPFYPLYRFYFFYGYPYWGFGGSFGWGDDGYRGRSEPPEERTVRGRWGEVWFDVQPEDAWVYVDGQLWGRAGDLNGWWKSRRVRAGDHQIRVEHERYPPQEFSVRVPPEETVTVRVDLRSGSRSTGGGGGPSSAEGRATLWVQTNAERPRFRVDGQAIAAQYDAARQAWGLDVAYGTHTLEVQADGYEASVQPIRVTSDGAGLVIQLTPRGP